jgi:MFS family permease
MRAGALLPCALARFALAQMLSAPALGRVSDARGRKPVLLLTTGGTIAGFILLGAANSLPILFVARILDGLTGKEIARTDWV